MALADNLLFAWEFGEASGDALDSHGAENLSEVGGSIPAAAGPAGTDGSRDPERSSTQYFESAGDIPSVTGNTDLTWEIWFRPEQDGIDQTLFSKGTGANAEYWAYVQGNLAAVRVRVWGSSGYGNENGMVYAGSISANNWYHAVVTHDAANNVIAVVVNDGTPATVSHSAGIYAGTGTFRVGEFPGFGTAFDGRVAKCRVWGRVLTGAEITELYNSGSGRDYAYITGGGGAPVSVTPPAVVVRTVGVNPTVRQGSLAVTPAAAAARVVVSPPVVGLGPVVPVVAAVKAAATPPTVQLGSVVISGRTAIVRVTGLSVSVVMGAVVPGAAAVRAFGLGPTVVLGSVAVTPGAAVAHTSLPNPSVFGDGLAVTPAFGLVKVVSLGPTVRLGSVTLTPTAASLKASTANPTVTLSSVSVTPNGAIVRSPAVNPTVRLGSVAVNPATVTVRVTAPSPGVRYGPIIPPVVTVRTGAASPILAYGSLTITPAVVGVRVVGVSPTVFDGIIPPSSDGPIWRMPDWARARVYDVAVPARVYWMEEHMAADPESGLTLYITQRENKTFGVDFSREGPVRDGAVLSAPAVSIEWHSEETGSPTKPTPGAPEVIPSGEVFTDSDGRRIRGGKGVRVRVNATGAALGRFVLRCSVRATPPGGGGSYDTLEGGGVLVVE